MAGWKECKLGDFIDVINGFAFKSSNFLEEKKNDALPVIKIRNVANGDVHLSGVQYHLYNETLSKVLVEKGDILIALTGNHPQAMTQVVGDASRYKLNQPALLNQRVAKLKPKQDLDIEYLYYFLKDDLTHDYLASQSSGSANQANISKSDIENIPIQLPPLPEQKAIAEVLSSLDDKVDLLYRQNKTLEAMAETLFQQWFVEETKESWETTNLFDAVEVVGGGTPKTEVADYWDGNIKWISAKDITPNHKKFIVDTEKKITEQGLKNSSTRVLPRYATIISARGTVGNYCLLSESMTFSQSNYGIKPKFKDCYFFTYLLVANAVEELQSAAYGSVFDTITTNTFKEHQIKIPTEKEIQIFDERVKPYFEKMLSNALQIRSLTKLRDGLLPKLMSGDEVRVKF